MPKLHLIMAGQQLPEPPYPADTRARDWRFEIDLERVWQSDTWALCPPEISPWLWAIWIESWRCTPCGSYPNDDTVIAARLRMPINLFRAHQEILLRGWVQHADGRLYHPVLTEQVLKMIGKRNDTTERVRKWREQRAAKALQENQQLTNDVTRYQPVGDALETTPPPPPPPPPSLKDKHAARAPGASAPSIPNVDHQAVVDAYHELCPTLPKVMQWTERRQAILRQRWREYGIYEKSRGRGWTDSRDGVAAFRRFFGFVAKSEFLTGRSKAAPGREPFLADLEWLLNAANFVKICEGKYSL